MPGTGTGCGLELLPSRNLLCKRGRSVSMPSWAWVVTARMSNILNFSWYFLCIPAIYRCILAYLPIFFNQLSKFFRCESPSTFLGTCLSHHSFIIFLVTNTNTLLSGLYLISTHNKVASFITKYKGVNALSGLYLISTAKRGELMSSTMIVSMPSRAYTSFLRYPFKNLGFMRFPEPVFAGIYQNILTTAVLRAC